MARHRLVAAEPPDDRRRAAGVAHGGMATKAEDHGPGSLGSGLPVHQHGLGCLPEAPQSRALDEPARELPRQRGGRELLQSAQARANPPQGSTGRARRQGRTCSTTSRCSTIPDASTSGTGCCHPSSSNGSTRCSPQASTKLGAIQRSAAPSPHGRRTTAATDPTRPSATSRPPSSPSNPSWKSRSPEARNETQDSPSERRRKGSQVTQVSLALRNGLKFRHSEYFSRRAPSVPPAERR